MKPGEGVGISSSLGHLPPFPSAETRALASREATTEQCPPPPPVAGLNRVYLAAGTACLQKPGFYQYQKQRLSLGDSVLENLQLHRVPPLIPSSFLAMMLWKTFNHRECPPHLLLVQGVSASSCFGLPPALTRVLQKLKRTSRGPESLRALV